MTTKTTWRSDDDDIRTWQDMLAVLGTAAGIVVVTWALYTAAWAILGH